MLISQACFMLSFRGWAPSRPHSGQRRRQEAHRELRPPKLRGCAVQATAAASEPCRPAIGPHAGAMDAQAGGCGTAFIAEPLLSRAPSASAREACGGRSCVVARSLPLRLGCPALTDRALG